MLKRKREDEDTRAYTERNPRKDTFATWIRGDKRWLLQIDSNGEWRQLDFSNHDTLKPYRCTAWTLNNVYNPHFGRFLDYNVAQRSSYANIHVHIWCRFKPGAIHTLWMWIKEGPKQITIMWSSKRNFWFSKPNWDVRLRRIAYTYLAVGFLLLKRRRRKQRHRWTTYLIKTRRLEPCLAKHMAACIINSKRQ
jgi:hypothetical protein